MEEDNINASDEENTTEEAPAVKKFWYAVQCLSQYEYKVKKRLEDLMEMEFKDSVFRVLLPEEETVEIKNNMRKEKVSKIYPGYLFVEMLPDEEIWFKIRRLHGVMKLVGDKNEPTPVDANEIDKILGRVGEKKVEVDLEVNESVKVVSGPFRGYSGTIAELYPDRGKAKTMISIFGRETPVELEFDQVEKSGG